MNSKTCASFLELAGAKVTVKSIISKGRLVASLTFAHILESALPLYMGTKELKDFNP